MDLVVRPLVRLALTLEGKARQGRQAKQAPRQGRADPMSWLHPHRPNSGSKWLSQTRAPAEAHAHGSCSKEQGAAHHSTLLGWLMLWHLVQPIPKAVTDGR